MFFMPTDNIRDQFIGPVTATLLIIKHRNELQAAFPAQPAFASNNDVAKHILDIMFSPTFADLRTNMSNALANDEEKVLLNDAFSAIANLSPDNKMRALDFINHALQSDHGWVQKTAEVTQDLTPGPYQTHVIEWFGDADVRAMLGDITPVARPAAEKVINEYGIYGSYADLNYYASAYGTYNYNYYNDPSYSYYNYESYYSYGTYGYADTHANQQAAETSVLLRDFINSKLQSSGIMGWKYKTNHSFTDVQLDMVASKVVSELPALRDLRFSQTAWGHFGSSIAAIMLHSRTLEQQIFASISESSKSDKSIKPSIIRG